jgi:hypothetical protein
LSTEEDHSSRGRKVSAAEAIESAALPLQSVDYIECSHGLPLGMLSVGDRVTHHVLQEGAKDVAGLLIDETGDALDAATTSQSPDCGLSDTEDSLLEGLLGVSLGANLAIAFANFASSCHVCSSYESVKNLKFIILTTFYSPNSGN